MTCDLCAARSGLHDFRRLCCRVRFLLALPAGEQGRKARRGWLCEWGREYGQEAMEQTEDAVLAAWEEGRAQAKAARDALRSKIAQERTR